MVTPASPGDSALAHLDQGEAQAIALALERQADLLLLDERDGAIAARARGLDVTGTLRETTFRCPVRLMEIMLQQDALRKQSRRP